MKVEIMAGSARRGSLSKRVALHLYEMLSRNEGLEVGIIDMQEYHLPPVQDVWQKPADAPLHLVSIATRMFDAGAFILVSPEYNGSYSPALKNSSIIFQNRNGRCSVLPLSSPGNQGGMRAALQLQNLMFGLCGVGVARMLVVPEVDQKFNEDDALLDPTFATAVDAFTSEFLWLSSAVYDSRCEERGSFNGFLRSDRPGRIIGFQ